MLFLLSFRLPSQMQAVLGNDSAVPSNRPFQKNEKETFKQGADNNDYKGPRKQIGRIQIDFGHIEPFPYGIVWNTDDFCRDARFPAHAQSDFAAADQIGKYRRPVDIMNSFPAGHSKDRSHLQKIQIRASQAGQRVHIDNGENHQKRTEDGQLS